MGNFNLDWIFQIILLVLGCYLSYKFGIKHSDSHINRKYKLYGPLVEKLELISTSLNNSDMLEKIDFSDLSSTVKNNYSNAINKSIIKDIKNLVVSIEAYNKISVTKIALTVIEDIFVRGFESLYGEGSIVEGVINSYEEQIEIEVYVEELNSLRRTPNEEIEKLIKNKGNFNYQYEYEYTYEELIWIYSGAFNRYINGVKIPSRKMLINWDGTPSEYIALSYDFFSEYDNHEKIKKKKKLKEIILKDSKKIEEEIKMIINKITKKYEKEKISLFD